MREDKGGIKRKIMWAMIGLGGFIVFIYSLLIIFPDLK